MLQLIGLVGLSASFLLLNESLRFPGALAAMPVMATVVFIAGIHGGHGFASRLLSQRFPVFVGRLSYSLYLWHWPINSFVDYAAASQNDMLRAGGKVALTMALSLLSFYVIESPFRKWLAAPAAGWTAIGVVVSAIALSPLGITINREGYPRAWLQDLRDGGRVFNRGGQRGAVALYGDSIAASFAKVVIEACVANDCECQVFAVPGGNPVPKSQAGSDGMWEQAVAAWRLEKPSMVIVAIAWLPYLREDPTLITTMVDELRPLTRRIVLLSVAPELPVKEVRAYLREGGKLPLCEDVERSVVRRRINANLRELVGGNVTVIDVDKYFVDPTGVMRVLDTAGNSLFHDQGHLAYRGTLLLKQAIWNEIGRMPEKPVD